MSSKKSIGSIIICALLASIGSYYFYTRPKENLHTLSCNCERVSKHSTILNILTQAAPEDMVKIPSGTFMMGGHDSQAKSDELPLHQVKLEAFYLDITEVTNEQFEKFVSATNYITTAEKPIDWDLLKLQLPPSTPKPSAEKLAPGSLVFIPPNHPVDLNEPNNWWHWVSGANWRHPLGPDTQNFGKDHPVVHVTWEDAQAYCHWRGKRLPTEAEREWAARGGLENKTYPWGDSEIELSNKTNIWEGKFPYQSTKKDQYYWTTPVKQFPPNGYGLYDMGGNVWEWTDDLYDLNYYLSLKQIGVAINPRNTNKSFDPNDPNVKKYVLRGGSFLCHKSYCAGYRVSARMRNSPDTSMIHLGFRCAKDIIVKQ